MKDDHSTVLDIGAHVRMTRRPYFSGKIVAIQQEIFEDDGERRFFCWWRFKPAGWASKRPLSPAELEAVKKDE